MAITPTQVSREFSTHPSRPSPYEFVTDMSARASRLLIALLDWRYRALERRQLLGLSDAALKDFGASRADAEAEGTKPFWRA